MSVTSRCRMQVDHCTLSAVMLSGPKQLSSKYSMSHTPTLYLPDGSYDMAQQRSFPYSLNSHFSVRQVRGNRGTSCGQNQSLAIWYSSVYVYETSNQTAFLRGIKLTFEHGYKLCHVIAAPNCPDIDAIPQLDAQAAIAGPFCTSRTIREDLQHMG